MKRRRKIMSFDFEKETTKSNDAKLEQSLAQTLKNKKTTKPKKKNNTKLGRPKGRTKVTVTFSLKPSTRDKLRKIANDNGYPAMSEFLENLINDENFRSDIVWDSKTGK